MVLDLIEEQVFQDFVSWWYECIMYHVITFHFISIYVESLRVPNNKSIASSHSRLRTSAPGRNSCPMDCTFPQKVPTWWDFSRIVAKGCRKRKDLISNVVGSESYSESYMNLMCIHVLFNVKSSCRARDLAVILTTESVLSTSCGLKQKSRREMMDGPPSTRLGNAFVGEKVLEQLWFKDD